jgi:integrase
VPTSGARRAVGATLQFAGPRVSELCGLNIEDFEDNVRQNVIAPVVAHANVLRIARGENRIRAHITPHTFRRTYITFMVAAGYDIPYIQAQVGHKGPTTTLAIYAQVMRRPDRDQLRAEIRDLLGVTPQPPEPPAATVHRLDRGEGVASVAALRGAEKAGKGRAIGL